MIVTFCTPLPIRSIVFSRQAVFWPFQWVWSLHKVAITEDYCIRWHINIGCFSLLSWWLLLFRMGKGGVLTSTTSTTTNTITITTTSSSESNRITHGFQIPRRHHGRWRTRDYCTASSTFCRSKNVNSYWNRIIKHQHHPRLLTTIKLDRINRRSEIEWMNQTANESYQSKCPIVPIR